VILGEIYMGAEISDIDAELVFDRMLQLALEDTGEAAREHLAAGRAVYYGDEKYPHHAVKEYPDGHKELIDFDKNGREYVIKAF
jgi:hypothetical protein